jgi:predicted  nucleic acid-binding Zn-ribbon protein
VIEQLVALAKIAEIDAEALRADTELRDLPQRVDAMQSDVNKLGEILSAEKAQLADADRLLGAQDEELNNQSQNLARSKAKGARVRNTREADAVDRELETIRRLMKERETERDTLREVIAKRRSSIEKHEREFKELETIAATEKQKSDARVAELSKQREQILAGRGALATKVPADVMRRYEMIRSKRQGLGVAAIKDSTCSGCFVVLAPQQVIAIQRAEDFAQCPRCQRILYSPEALAKWQDGKPSS